MKCKKVLGMRICKLNSAEIIHLPNKVDYKIPVNIYTSKKCSLCKSIVNKQLKSLSPLKGLIDTKIVDVDQSKSIHPDVLSLPSMEIGNKIIGSYPSDYNIIKNLRNQLSIKKVR